MFVDGITPYNDIVTDVAAIFAAIQNHFDLFLE